MSGMPPHFPGAPGWEEVADFAIDWAERHAGLTVAEHAAAKDPVSGDDLWHYEADSPPMYPSLSIEIQYSR
jgi:hypothetical protein